MHPHSWKVVVAVVAVVGTISCARDNPTAPPSQIAVPHTASSTLFPSPVIIVPLQRVTPLTTNQQVSATIGIFGGTLTIPNAGLTLVVPPLAVLSPTTITATALAGSSVAYEFAPHGLQFMAPVVATQSLVGTQAGAGGPLFGQPLYVGYFASSGLISSVTELLNAPVNLLGVTSTAILWHFSGYTWSSGREGEPADSTAHDQ
jgi:hypothetical protein